MFSDSANGQPFGDEPYLIGKSQPFKLLFHVISWYEMAE